MTTADDFAAAKEKVMTLTEKPNNEILLNLYALAKQAEIGEINIDPPKMFDFVAQAKYNAWKSKAGMTQEAAMQAYVDLVNSLF